MAIQQDVPRSKQTTRNCPSLIRQCMHRSIVEQHKLLIENCPWLKHQINVACQFSQVSGQVVQACSTVHLFAHGQLYVGVSRVRKRMDITVLWDPYARLWDWKPSVHSRCQCCSPMGCLPARIRWQFLDNFSFPCNKETITAFCVVLSCALMLLAQAWHSCALLCKCKTFCNYFTAYPRMKK